MNDRSEDQKLKEATEALEILNTSVKVEIEPYTASDIRNMSSSKANAWFYGLVKNEKGNVLIATIHPGIGYGGIPKIMWDKAAWQRLKALSPKDLGEEFEVDRLSILCEALKLSEKQTKSSLMIKFKRTPGERPINSTKKSCNSKKSKTITKKDLAMSIKRAKEAANGRGKKGIKNSGI